MRYKNHFIIPISKLWTFEYVLRKVHDLKNVESTKTKGIELTSLFWDDLLKLFVHDRMA